MGKGALSSAGLLLPPTSMSPLSGSNHNLKIITATQFLPFHQTGLKSSIAAHTLCPYL